MFYISIFFIFIVLFVLWCMLRISKMADEVNFKDNIDK